jgi:hypothetical protein
VGVKFKSTLVRRLAGLLLLSIPTLAPVRAQEAGNGCKGILPEEPGQAPAVLVATRNCTIAMSPDEYRTFVKSLKRLPDLPDSYVFGHIIPKPAVDRDGHVHVLSAAEPTAPKPIAAVTTAKPASSHPDAARGDKPHPAPRSAKAEHPSMAPTGEQPSKPLPSGHPTASQ